MIESLIQDIYKTVQTKGWFHDELAKDFGTELSKRLQVQFNESPKVPTLRLSQMGPRCPRALWYSIHAPAEAEQLPPWASIKYSYGHIIEALAIALAKASGHSVTGEQDELTVDGIVGHRDCVIDGHIVDVKSTNSRGFIRFKDKSFAQDDMFGYLDQLDGYMVGSSGDPLVTNKSTGYILAVDKSLGHMVLYEHTVRPESIKQRIEDFKLVVALPGPPACECGVRSHGASGNMQLDTKASYSPFKHCCFPNLRTFIYAKDGPVYLTRVVRKPDVMEVDKNGKIVYNG
jgi:hypothetical protein